MDHTILDKLTVSDIIEPTRCIDYLIGKFEVCSTRNALKKAMKRREVLINGKIANTGDWIKNGDIIELLETIGHQPKKFDIDIPIVYEDEFVMVVNKPAGLLTSGNSYDSLVNAIAGKGTLSKAPDAWSWFRPIHRLDRATSGLIILSKTATVHREMVKLFEERKINKVYVAIVKGAIEQEGTIEEPIDRKKAITLFKRVKLVHSVKNEFLSLVELYPKTGRTHQLRIHCAGIGHPIFGDKLYDDPKLTISHKGLFLAAIGLKFIHPMTGKELEIGIPVPEKFTSLLEREERWFERIKNADTDQF